MFMFAVLAFIVCGLAVVGMVRFAISADNGNRADGPRSGLCAVLAMVALMFGGACLWC